MFGGVLGKPRQTEEALHVQVVAIVGRHNGVGRVHRDVVRALPHVEGLDRRRRLAENRLGYEAEHLPIPLPKRPVVLDTGPLKVLFMIIQWYTQCAKYQPITARLSNTSK